RDTLQRFDINTNAPVGPAYPAPLTLTNSAGTVALVPVGTKLYLSGFVRQASDYLRHNLVFDTATAEYTVLADFPQALGLRTASWALSDGRILTTTTSTPALPGGNLC